MSQIDVYRTMRKLTKSCPWLKMCLRRMDVTNIDGLHELTEIVTKNAKID